jgi:hypothetical protein
MNRSACLARAILRIAILMPLAACQDGSGFFGKLKPAADGSAMAAPATSVKLVDRDVEAPDVFQVTEQALWDGRPSLGGVWVAAPDVTDPERVILRNPGNGKFVIGALFRREIQNPGPRLQISSDAAEALGILAGQPIKLSVTALRREEPKHVTPDAANPILATNEPLATEDTDPNKRSGAKPGEIAVATLPAGNAATPKPTSANPVTPPPAPALAAAAASAGAGRTIQIGIFSVEANAKRAVDTLAKAGIPAAIAAEQAKGKALWSVTTRGDAGSLSKIKGAGFADAYFLKG